MAAHSWRLSPHTAVDRYERKIRDWTERQINRRNQPEGWNEPTGSLLWHFSAMFLQRYGRIACTRVHVQMGRLYKKMRKRSDEWVTFEQAMSTDRLSEFGACQMTLWLLDCCLPADVRIMMGLAEEIDGDEIVPVVLVMEAGLMVIDPTRKVTGRYPKTLSKLKRHVVLRCFDVHGSYTLDRVVVDIDQSDFA